MIEHFSDMLLRAAKHSPLFSVFDFYNQAKGEDGRPLPRTYDWCAMTSGTIRWLDYDQIARTYGGTAGDGIVSEIGRHEVPDLILCRDGWLGVQSAEGMDALGATVKFRVRRWTGDAPVIRHGRP